MKDNIGFIKIETIADYWGKLCWEYHELKKDSSNTYKVFNFTVTAFHLLDWVEPDKKSSNRAQLKEGIKFLKVCEQLANGAKHFEIDRKRHNSVSFVENEQFVEDDFIDEDYFENSIIITLSDSTTVSILEFAENLMNDWERELKKENII